MDSKEKSLDETLQALRRLAAAGRPLAERHWSELARRLQGLREFPVPIGDAAARRALTRARSEAACLLLRFAADAEAPGLLVVCLEGLLSLGGFGRLAALGLIERCRLSLEDILQLLARQGGLVQLELIDFHRRAERDPQAAQSRLFTDLLASVQEASPMEAGQYLVASLRDETEPAYLVVQTLLAGAFGVAVKTTLAAPNTPSELRKTALALKASREDDLLEGLGRHLERSDAPPDLLEDLLSAVRALSAPGRGLLRTVAALLKRPEQGVRLAAFETLASWRVGHLERFAAELVVADPDLLPGLLVRLPLLEADGLERFLEALAAFDPQARRFAAETLVRRLSVLEPETFAECLRRVAAERGDSFVAPVVPLLTGPRRPSHPAPARTVPPGGLKAAVLKRIKGQDDAPREVEACQGNSVFTGLAFDGGLEGGEFHGSVLDGCRLSGVVFVRCRFRSCDFLRSELRGAILRECLFENCRFEACDLDAAVVELTDFADCRFVRCLGTDALFHGARLSTTELVESSLHGARFLDSRLTCVGLRACDLSAAGFEFSELAGVDMDDCCLEEARFLGGSAVNSPMAACRTANCRVEETRTDEPLLLRLAERTLLRGLAEAEPDMARDMRRIQPKSENRPQADAPSGARHPASQPAAPRSASGAASAARQSVRQSVREDAGPDDAALAKWAAQAAQALLLAWQRRRDLRRRAAVYLADNRRRFAWTVERLGPVKGELFAIMPFLLRSDAFDRMAGLEGVPPCRLAGYAPGWRTLAAARKHLPDAALPSASVGSGGPGGPDGKGEAPLVIEGLYTIGSVGTVAMGPDSDVDYWVCAGLGRLAPGREEGLRRKLERLESWAAKAFGLEIHFFLMDDQRVREDNFGFSDAESSGSAQARMLKEEFYRTAIRAAGRLPLWWLAEPGADRAAYAALPACLGSEAASFIDLGHMESIPPEEFFGASLWQIVKALKSPFKSIMKFALLESCVDDSQLGGLLCDRVKERLFLGRRDVWLADPYAALFKDIADYYVKIEDQDALELARFSFFLKVGMQRRVAEFGPAARPEERSLKRLFAKHKGARSLSYKDLAPASERLTFQERIRLGALVSQFIVKTYLRVRDRRKTTGAVSINPQDLTKLGRRISATLGRRERKIDRFPFTSLGGGAFRALYFSVVRLRGKTLWSAQGAEPSRDGSRLELALLRREERLPALLAWLAVNGVHARSTEVKCDYSMSPVASADVESLLRRLAEFFPKQAFEPDLDENLKEERVVRAFFILNLTVPRKTDRIAEAALLYCNNWGELFCLTGLPAEPLARIDPWRYLQKILPDKCPEPPALEQWLPERGQCNGLRQLSAS